jgi:hypothetical protein
MKQIRMAVIVMALVLSGLTSCTKDNSGTAAVSASTATTNTNSITGKPNVKGEPGVVATTLEQARWKISSFSGISQNGTDFTGYEFTFVDGGYVAAINGEVVYNGSWSASDQTYNLLLDFGTTTPPISNLNSEWHITQLSNEAISVQRTNGTASFIFQKVGPNTPGS